jgi:hypothetical protein
MSGSGGRTVIDSKSMRSFGVSKDGTQEVMHDQSMITAKEWRRLRRSIDVNAFFALPSPTECLLCVDAPVDWVMVEFDNGTKKVVDYDWSKPPQTLFPLFHQLDALYKARPNFGWSTGPAPQGGDIDPALLKRLPLQQKFQPLRGRD